MADFTTLLKEVLRPRQGDPLDRFAFNDNMVSNICHFPVPGFVLNIHVLNALNLTLSFTDINVHIRLIQ